MEDIATLLEKNPNITRLTSDGKDTLTYPYALQQPTPELAKKVNEEYPQFQSIVQRINDSLARNRAIASSIWARVFSNALPIDQTSSTRPNSIADANQLLASHILNNSSNLDEFQRTMIEIALSTEELADKAMPPPVTQQTNDEGIVLQNTHQHNGEPDATG
jgi:methyl-accepting chemotaxis protein